MLGVSNNLLYWKNKLKLSVITVPDIEVYPMATTGSGYTTYTFMHPTATALNPVIYSATNGVLISTNSAAGYTTAITKSSGTTTAIYIKYTGSNITGSLANSMTSLYLIGDNLYWYHTGSLPTGITGYARLQGNNIRWLYNSYLPYKTSRLFLQGNLINWTAFDLKGSGVHALTIQLNNYLTGSYMNGTQLLQLLTSAAIKKGGSYGTLPTNVYIKLYDNNGLLETDPSPSVAVINASTLQRTYADCTTLAQQLHYRIHLTINNTACDNLYISKT